MDREALKRALLPGLQTALQQVHGGPTAEDLAAKCAAHFELMLRWNNTHNLTRVTDPALAASRHYADVLLPAVLLHPFPPVEGPAWGPNTWIADIGSGAGFPGLILAMLWPTTRINLVEVAAKRRSFLQVAARELGLANVTVSSEPKNLAPLVVSRATFSPGDRRSLSDAMAENGTLWLWAATDDLSGWSAECSALGLEPLEALRYQTEPGRDRVILRAHKPPPK